MEFEPLHFGRNLFVINPRGHCGIVTLWSQPSWVLDRLREAGADLSPETSPVAVAGTLYGNGLPELLRNMLYNPQVNNLILCGADLSGTREQLVAFFEKGLENVDFLGEKKTAIAGTGRFIDSLVTREMFDGRVKIHATGDLKTEESIAQTLKAIATSRRPGGPFPDRQKVSLPGIETRRFPSNPRNHNIVEDDFLTAWRELIFRLIRFGRVVHLRKGDRIELQNVRAVIEKPDFIPDDQLVKFGFSPEHFKSYYHNFLDGDLPQGSSYTYGNRLVEYFRGDTVEQAGINLTRDPEDRKSYISLWDSGKDLASPAGHPCLVGLYLRRYAQRLTLTANFRTHNAMDAWLENCYGLLRVLHRACEITGMTGGAVTVISHSISLDPRRWDVARAVAQDRKYRLREDPLGNFAISVQDGEILLRHYHRGILMGEYRDKNPVRIQHQLARDLAVSDVGHAIYLGRMLERAYKCIQTGEEFYQ